MLDHLADHLIGGDIFGFGLEVENDAVTQRGVNNPLDIIIAHMNPPSASALPLAPRITACAPRGLEPIECIA